MRSHMNLQAHFARRHPGPTIVILEEGSHPHPHCPCCEVFLLHLAMWKKNPETAMCEAGLVWRQQELALARARKAEGVELMVQGRPLEKVEPFWYLWRLLTSSDLDWPKVQASMHRARKIWARIARVLTREGTTGFRQLLQSCGAVGVVVWVRDVGHDGEDPGSI